MKSMKILLTNEKGCFDAGIVALAKIRKTKKENATGNYKKFF